MNIFLQKQVHSFANAFQGIAVAIVRDFHCKVHIVATVAVLIAAIVFAVSLFEWLILLLCISMVICLELVNTAIEHLVDMVSPEKRDSAKHAKDIAAGAVLVASMFSFIIGCIIFLPKIISL
jgi:undecaprenol kinase